MPATARDAPREGEPLSTSRRRHGRRRTTSLVAAGALTLAMLPVAAAAQSDDRPGPRGTELACPPGSTTSDFPDIAGSVHADNIRCLADLGIARGKVGGAYAPREQVRRDQMATVVVNAVESYTGVELAGGDTDRFPDVPADNVHRRAINKLAASGWVQGRRGGLYDPAALVTRGQMARFIAGSLSFLDDGNGTNGSAPPASSVDAFGDDDGSVFEADIDALAAQGIVSGFADGTYRPSAGVLRDQMASFIARGYDYAVAEQVGGGPAVPAPEFEETSRLVVEADALQVVDGEGAFRRGEPGATATFDLRLDSVNDLICYDITLRGVSGDYQSPASTATHIHRNDFGLVGPPVVAFPNPQPLASDPDVRRSQGCLDSTLPSFPDDAPQGGDADPGRGFEVAELEADPSAFYVDSHTVAYPGGAVRGQLGATDVFDVPLSWHDEVDEDGLFGVGEPGAEGDALVVVFDGTDPASGTAADEVCAAITTDASAPFDGGPGAHLHDGSFDENGPVVVGFATPDDDGVSTSCTSDFAEGFTPAQAAADPAGYYVNVHSDAFPAGAVRGQLPGGTGIAPGEETSSWLLVAGPDEVVGGGQPGAEAVFELRFDSTNQVVCYGIVSQGIDGAYASPAVTATHIHQAVAGVAGPPRVAFANPVATDPDLPADRSSQGCARVPQRTGTAANGADNGAGFDLAAIEADPDGYYVDIHTVGFEPGAVRAQFSQDARLPAGASVAPTAASTTRSAAADVAQVSTPAAGQQVSEFGCHFERA
ncbi:CHRD domain-containing protein [Nitriliruptoraceae bacterium ZYF776]|nr:CHRD domain-containing protein [Profundirhabdus halotolerans]